jgi:hypothetical protein
MAPIFKNGKFIEDSSLSDKDYQLFRKIYEKASVLAVKFISKILREYGDVLDFEDFEYIDNLLPKESNYKTWYPLCGIHIILHRVLKFRSEFNSIEFFLLIQFMFKQ